jgi:hypothetical protein
MITLSALGDLKANAAFQQARHQNNFYYAQEMLKSAADGSGGPSPVLNDLQTALAAISFPTSVNKNQNINLLQDALALQHFYLTPAQIEHHFLDGAGNLKPGFVPFDEMTYGRLALALMKEALDGYTGKDVKKQGKTRDEYVELKKDLAAVKIAGIKSRNDLWVEVNKEAKLEGFAKKVNLSQKKIKDHEEYLNAGFFALAENAWWSQEDKTKPGAYAAESAFRNHVLQGKPYKPVCYMRATSTAPRGTYQGRKPEDSTRRVVFKNPPWSMTELAALFNGATSEKITAAMAGTEPPLNRLDGVANPFNNVVFQVSGTWYIMGGRVDASDNLILQKVELQVGPDGKPQKDDKGYIKKLSTANTEIVSMFSVSEMKRAKDASGNPMNVNKLVEDGLQTLIKACDYGVSVNDKPSDEVDVGITADAGAPVLFVMDDTALLREWLLTPGFDLGSSAIEAQQAIFNGLSDVERNNCLDNIRAASVAGLSPTAQDAALQKGPIGVYDFLRLNPAARAALAQHAAKAAVAHPDPNQAAIEAIKNRGADKGAAFKALPNMYDKAAFKVLILGGVLAKFMERAPIIEAMTPNSTERAAAESALLDEVNAMITNEKHLFTTPLAFVDINLKGGLSGALGQIITQINQANKNVAASTLFATQRAELVRAVGYHVDNMPCSSFSGALVTNDVSLAAANIIPMPSARPPYTPQDIHALKAIAWVDVMDTLITALKADPNLSAADLVTLLDQAIKDQNGILTHLNDAELTNLRAQQPGFVIEYVSIKIDTEVNQAAKTHQFASQLPACIQVRDDIQNAISESTTNNTTLIEEILNAPPANKLFEVASLPSVAKAIEARKLAGDPSAIGFARRADTAEGAIVLEAAASGAENRLEVGLMHYATMNPGVPLVVNANGKKLEIMECAAPKADAIPGKTYFKVMDGTNEYRPIYEERVELQKQLQVELERHAVDAMNEAAVRPDSDTVVQVTPNKDDPHRVDIDGTQSKTTDEVSAKTSARPTRL